MIYYHIVGGVKPKERFPVAAGRAGAAFVDTLGSSVRFEPLLGVIATV